MENVNKCYMERKERKGKARQEKKKRPYNQTVFQKRKVGDE